MNFRSVYIVKPNDSFIITKLFDFYNNMKGEKCKKIKKFLYERQRSLFFYCILLTKFIKEDIILLLIEYINCHRVGNALHSFACR
jgi:hypothetical protein